MSSKRNYIFKRIFKRKVCTRLFHGCVILSLFLISCSVIRDSLGPTGIRQKILLITIDLEDFQCPVCMEQFSALFSILEKKSNSCLIFTILTSGIIDTVDLKEAELIMMHQFTGWMKANDFHFAFTLAEGIVILNPEGTSSFILFRDSTKNLARKWDLPLTLENISAGGKGPEQQKKKTKKLYYLLNN